MNLDSLSLAPLPYQRRVVAYLREHEPELWRWGSSAEVHGEQAQAARIQLLKQTYRLESAAHPEVASCCSRVAQRLGIEAPVTLYQSSAGTETNAMLCYLPGEAHVIFMGPLLSLLQGAQLEAVLAHELAHFRLFEMENGAFLVADRLLAAAVSDPRCCPSHSETARRYRLYMEVYADRGALVGSQDLDAAVSALVKTQTGLQQVSAASYLRQADEIFSSAEQTRSEGLDHPETFIRARALHLWAQGDAQLEVWLPAMIEGRPRVDALDLTGQVQFAQLTRRLLAQLLRPAWVQTPITLAYARQYFDDFAPATAVDPALPDELRSDDRATNEYLCYLLLDLAAADPELEDLPLAAVLTWSEQLGIAQPFEKLLATELKVGKRQLNKLKKDAPDLLAKAELQR